MEHNYTNTTDDNSGDHWAVGNNGDDKVLVQLQVNGDQVRIPLTTEQAAEFGYAVMDHLTIVDSIQLKKEHDENEKFEYLATLLRVSGGTIKRWLASESAPHDLAFVPVVATLCNEINRLRDLEKPEEADVILDKIRNRIKRVE